MSFTGSNICNQSATKLPTCGICNGEGMVYPFVKKECLLCEGKSTRCSECGGCGYVRIIEPTKCEDCQGTGVISRIALALSMTSP